jgi:hypothetical protein
MLRGLSSNTVSMTRSARHQVAEGLNLWGIAQVHAHRVLFAEAHTTAQAALSCLAALARELGVESLYCPALARLGQMAVESGDVSRAAALLAASLRSSARIADRESQAAALSTCLRSSSATGR